MKLDPQLSLGLKELFVNTAQSRRWGRDCPEPEVLEEGNRGEVKERRDEILHTKAVTKRRAAVRKKNIAMMSLTQLTNCLTLDGSFSSVSTATIARVVALCSIL